MTDLFAFAQAQRLRDEGMTRAEKAQGETWTETAYRAIERIALAQLHVHIDDVLRAGVPQPHHFNAWGAVWARAIRAGIIQPSLERRPCTVDPKKHAHKYPVYFSRIHDPRAP